MRLDFDIVKQQAYIVPAQAFERHCMRLPVAYKRKFEVSERVKRLHPDRLSGQQSLDR